MSVFSLSPPPHRGLALALALALSLAAPGAVLAAEATAPDAETGTETESESESLPATDMTVSAPRPQGVPQARVAGAETTVTAQDIEDQQIRRLEDALDLVPGLTLSGQRGLGQPQSIGLRGLGPRNTRVFIDGIEVSDPSSAQSKYEISDHNLSDVERVEVLRGARPGRFGADTAGGVVNIITRRPTEPFGGEASVEYGSYNTTRLRGLVHGLQGPVDFRLSAAGTTSDGFSDFSDERGGRPEDPFWSWTVGGTLGLALTDDLRVDVTGRYLREELNYDANDRDTSWNRDESERFIRGQVTLETLNDTLVHTLGLSDTWTTRQYWGEGTKGDTFDGGKTRLDYVAAWAASDRISLEAGGDVINESMEQHTPGFAPLTPDMDADLWRGGAFLTLGVTPVDNLDLAGSVRVDTHETFGDEVTYRLSGAYTIDPTGTTLRGSYATAWQTPSLYEQYDPCAGNADLDPESSWGWDVGVDQRLWDERLVGSVTYFETTTKDEIDWVWSPPTNSLCLGGGYQNINKTFAQGVEMALTVRPHDDVDVVVSYTWQNAIDDQTGKRLDKRPVNQGTASVTWRFLPAALANVGLRYRDRTTDFGGESDAFWTADLRLAYDVTERVTLHGRVENLFDADYEEIPGYGTPGQSFHGGVTVRF
ncbi:TonB-dependent receptor plug domain-containing protein [Roseospira visakhapatnamensis]|uniref:Vitamin B12 transporter n=1 Tax=Roseospira visakhapatnamensis TaxID=390880 RepID=A0A7W6RDD0_9PROT|nr:TonB-dependent receptor [Roseospira visakhapatnamensis]MBB4266499.1 vitamin B12 transporter [Roseospira visakhapatnamensis]